MDAGILLWFILLLPLACAVVCQLLRRQGIILAFISFGVLCISVLDIAAAWLAFSKNTLDASGQWLRLDALSAYHIIVMAIVFCTSSFYSRHYFDREINEGKFNSSSAKWYGSLWFASLAAMTLVLVSNNLGVMWVGMETTTLVTAFLICIRKDKASIEGMWKYLIVCSVGIAFAFMGTLFVAASTYKLGGDSSGGIFWTKLRESAAQLDPRLMKIGFIFIFVGYGTKAGLSPMHTWLPDAHSQAPSPVSAIFSGFMLNAALYCIMRYSALIRLVPGNTNLSRDLFLVFGTMSIMVAAAFILFQHDLKRLLAYSSVEHIGIITLGLGLGYWGIFAALFHTLNHSICKSLGFFCAGRLGQIYGTYNMKKMSGAWHLSAVWGGGFFGVLLSLIGVAPFALFMSEFLIAKAAVSMNFIWAFVVFLACTCIVFAGVLRHAIAIVYGRPPSLTSKPASESFVDKSIVVVSLGILLVLGFWMPDGFSDMLSRAAGTIQGLESLTAINVK